MAKELGLSLNPEDPANLTRLLDILELGRTGRDQAEDGPAGRRSAPGVERPQAYRRIQIIAGAGAFGAVTIATNMAGRGVDIKLGGDLAEEILSGVNRDPAQSRVQGPV